MAVADVSFERVKGSKALVERIEQRMNDQLGLDVVARVLIHEGIVDGIDSFCPVDVQSSYSPGELRKLIGELPAGITREEAVEERIKAAIAQEYPGNVPHFETMVIRSPYGGDE